jgi:hypothetical protein
LVKWTSHLICLSSDRKQSWRVGDRWTCRRSFHCCGIQGKIPCPPQMSHGFWEENTWGWHHSSSP